MLPPLPAPIFLPVAPEGEAFMLLSPAPLIVLPDIPVPVLSVAVLPIGEPLTEVESEDVVVVVLSLPQAARLRLSARAGIICRKRFIMIGFCSRIKTSVPAYFLPALPSLAEPEVVRLSVVLLAPLPADACGGIVLVSRRCISWPVLICSVWRCMVVSMVVAGVPSVCCTGATPFSFVCSIGVLWPLVEESLHAERITAEAKIARPGRKSFFMIIVVL